MAPKFDQELYDKILKLVEEKWRKTMKPVPLPKVPGLNQSKRN